MNASDYAASQGALALDKKLGEGWADSINVRVLDIVNGSAEMNGVPKCGCICAQLDGLYLKAHPAAARRNGFGKGATIRGNWLTGFRRMFGHSANSSKLGFSTGLVQLPDGTHHHTYFGDLTRAWKREVKARQVLSKA